MRSIGASVPAVPPPPEGYLPISGGQLNQSQIPFRVMFYQYGNYTGFEGVLLNDMTTVLTSALVAQTIDGSYDAVMGNVDIAAPIVQSALVFGGVIYTGWDGVNDASNIGYVVTSGFVIDPGIVESIEYSAAFDSTPYSGEYFYPVTTVVGWGSNLSWLMGPAILNVAEGMTAVVISDAALQAAVSGTDNTNIGASYTDPDQGAYGAGLIVAGYGGYFCAGVLSHIDVGNSLGVFTRASHFGQWISSSTGVNPIIYP